ncbi:hypothetical protein C9E81_13405 [Paracoccus alkanivorans]|uniref:Microcystin LR degradation protein MlrC N-terminal domain-containing protein n=1 Tax=Paracoccus alkanivorans TaxID=2116655 RepID=A0A3M0MF06_9RHOB|nr:hypothetical protein C9E81_13405 [Paracoccus alkanivorans]
MLANADVMIACKEYPYVDLILRLYEVSTLIQKMLEAEIRPVMRFVPCPIMGLWITTHATARAGYAGAEAGTGCPVSVAGARVPVGRRRRRDCKCMVHF